MQKQGIYRILDKEKIPLDIEYMDMKQFNTPENVRLFYEQLKYKLFHHKKYDIILTGDDAALHFVQDNQKELFNGIPIVFFCINDKTYAESFSNNPYITGAVENFYLEDTVRIAKKLQPHAQRIIGIYDDTLSGQGDQKQFYDLSQAFPEFTFSGIDCSAGALTDILKQMESVPPDSIVLYLSFFEDKDGNQYTIPEAVALISTFCPAPVYRTGLGGIGEGLIGGKVVSYTASGERAARIAVAILNGAEPGTIPIAMDGESQYIFDYRIVKKFGIPRRLIPKNAQLLNAPLSFRERYKEILFPLLILLGIFSTILLLITYDNRRRKRFTDLILYQAEHDYLTDLPNRRAAINLINTSIASKKKITLMILDIDNFKNINDTYGHICGDKILIEMARRMKNQMSVFHYTPFRLGGDEFLVISTRQTDQTKDILLEGIRDIFREPIVVNDKKHSIKTCIGIVCSCNPSATTSELLTKADLAMYTAKKAGKNSFAYFNDVMKAELDWKNNVEIILNEACANDGFYIVYQPQIDTDSGHTYGYEALLRLKQSDLGPARFIPVAESSETILTIGRIVTSKVIRQLAKWKAQGIEVHPVAINFSSKQLLDTDYVHFVKDLLDEYNISPDLIEIEITESVFIDNSEKSMQLFNDFSSIGVSLTLDDFGTGYSSISYLSYIPVHKIKLDKSLVDIYLQNGREGFIYNIIGLAHSLGLKITVEGVETKEQYEKLSGFSCDYIQGFFFSKPLSENEIEKSQIKQAQKS